MSKEFLEQCRTDPPPQEVNVSIKDSTNTSIPHAKETNCADLSEKVVEQSKTNLSPPVVDAGIEDSMNKSTLTNANDKLNDSLLVSSLTQVETRSFVDTIMTHHSPEIVKESMMDKMNKKPASNTPKLLNSSNLFNSRLDIDTSYLSNNISKGSSSPVKTPHQSLNSKSTAFLSSPIIYNQHTLPIEIEDKTTQNEAPPTSFQMKGLENVIDECLLSFHHQIKTDLTNLHTDMIHQFFRQKVFFYLLVEHNFFI